MRQEVQKRLATFFREDEGLPSLSPIAVQLVEMAVNDDVELADLASLISRDPSLAARLLRLANSVAFRGRSGEVRTVSQAVVRLGLSRVRLLALSISLRDCFPMGRVGPLDFDTFWRICLYRAVAAQNVARESGSVMPEEAFLGGLLLDIGLMVLFQVVIKDDPGVESLPMESMDFLLEWERNRYGVDHRWVGEKVLRRWRFPETLVALQSHDRGNTKESPCAVELATVIRVADRIAGLLTVSAREFNGGLAQDAAPLGLVPERIGDVLAETLEQVSSVAEALRVSVDRDKDLMVLMEKANRAIWRLAGAIPEAAREASFPRLPSMDELNEVDDETRFALEAVVHEIRNPLVAVGGFARRLVSMLEPESENARYAEVILKEAQRIEKVLQLLAEKVGTEGAGA